MSDNDTPSDALPDRLSSDPASPYYNAELLARDIGIRFKGVEKTNVEEYCVSEGWIRVPAGRALDRRGRRDQPRHRRLLPQLRDALPAHRQRHRVDREVAADQVAAEVVAEAQRLGYAEANPAMDVDGTDAAQKLSILAQLAFGARVGWKDIPRTGIDKLDLADVRYAQEMGYKIKLLAVAGVLQK